MKISAVVAVYNEEKNIARCLGNLYFCDEIIVVDSMSTDKTRQIARRFTKKIISARFTGFSDVKNAGIQKARGQWILSVDADEEITPVLRDEILRVTSLPEAADGYYIKRLTYFLSGFIRYSGWGNRDYQLRLFKKNAGLFEGEVHERVVIKGKTARIDEPMLHYSYPDSSVYISKMNRYTSMQAKSGRGNAIVKMIFNPVITFISKFFLKAGFKDGFRGFVLAVYSAFSEFVRYAKQAEIKDGILYGRGIVVRAPNWLGDCIMLTAYLAGLKSVFGKLVLAVRQGTEGVFDGNPYVDRVIIIRKKGLHGILSAADEIKNEGVKTAVSLAPSFSSNLTLFLSGVKRRYGYLDDLGVFFLTRAYRRDKTHRREHVMDEYANVIRLAGANAAVENLQELFNAVKPRIRLPKKYYVIAPFAAFGKSKAWPLEYYEELADKIMSSSPKNHVFLAGGKADENTGIRGALLKNTRFHDFRGKPLAETLGLIKRAYFFVGNDSGLSHAADALSVPMAVIFGATAPHWAGPVSENAKIIYRGIKCQPCFKKICRFGHYRCLTDVKPGEVFRIVRR